MPRRITAIAERHLKDPARIAIPEEKHGAKGAAPRVRQVAYLVSRAQKVDALGRILDLESPASALVFCRTRGEVETLAQTLNGRGYRAEALHGGMSQRDRDRVMGRFREGTAELLLATDVAARGLDIGRLSHVINYDVPPAPESYVHRIGRTGRAGREGVAITLVEPKERSLLRNIERLTGRPPGPGHGADGGRHARAAPRSHSRLAEGRGRRRRHGRLPRDRAVPGPGVRRSSTSPPRP